MLPLETSSCPSPAVWCPSSSSHRDCSDRLSFCASVRPNSGPGSSSLRLDLHSTGRRCSRVGRPSLSLHFCRASWGSSSERPSDPPHRWGDADQFLQATLLVSETIRHHNLRKQGFLEESIQHSSSHTHPLALHSKGFKSDIRSIGHGFLRRFHSPTIFLKVACEGDLLLPIVVGEFAIERLLETLGDDQDEESPKQFQFMRNVVETLGYEVKMVRITKRVINTYYANIFLGKTADRDCLAVDSRPSDAINLAYGFKAPIYVSKDIVLKDAIKIIYGSRRGDGSKTVYDVLLDSATEGHDLLAEEIDLVRKLNMAIIEERYKDAALCRDKLTKLRLAKHKS